MVREFGPPLANVSRPRVFFCLTGSSSRGASRHLPEIADQLHSGYGDGAPKGRGPSQKKITEEGNAFLKKDFKDLDFIKSAKIAE